MAYSHEAEEEDNDDYHSHHNHWLYSPVWALNSIYGFLRTVGNP
jgi:hypothetical protein